MIDPLDLIDLHNSASKSFRTPRPAKHLRARTLVYVAGPFTGKGETEQERRDATIANIRRATALGVRVAKLGAHPIVPHANCGDPRYWDPAADEVQSYDFWIEATGELLQRCDAILFTDDWLESSGARGEEKLAAEHGIPRFYTLSDLACWLLPGLASHTGQALPVLDTERPLCLSGMRPTLSDLAKTIPTLAPESNLSDPFSDAYGAYLEQELPTGVQCPRPQGKVGT